MKVAFDFSSVRTGGGSTYLREIVPRLVDRSDITVGPVLLRAEVRSQYTDLGDFTKVWTTTRFGAFSTRWRNAVRDESPDLVFVPTEISFVSYLCPYVLLIRNPNLDPATMREYGVRVRSRQAVYRFLARRSAARALCAAGVSEYARSLGIRFLRISEHRMGLAREGPGHQFTGEPSEDRTTPFRFLFVSNLYRYKNVHRLLQALSRVDGEWGLDVAGAVMPLEKDYAAELNRLTRDLGLEDRVVFHGYLTPEGLTDLYRQAGCFVWPSYAETFGHPLLEAHHYSLPIVAADAASNRETAGSAAVYFDPFDVDALTALLRRALAGDIRAGDLPRTYSWDDSADALVDLFRSALEMDGAHRRR